MDTNDWQDIETCPVDAKYILLWCPTWRHPFVGRKSPNPYMAWLDIPTPTATEIEVYARYWMPLAEPPKET